MKRAEIRYDPGHPSAIGLAMMMSHGEGFEPGAVGTDLKNAIIAIHRTVTGEGETPASLNEIDPADLICDNHEWHEGIEVAHTEMTVTSCGDALAIESAGVVARLVEYLVGTDYGEILILREGDPFEQVEAAGQKPS